MANATPQVELLSQPTVPSPPPEPGVQLCRQYEGGLLKVYGWQGNGKEVKSKDMQKSPPKPQSHPKTLLIVVR